MINYYNLLFIYLFSFSIIFSLKSIIILNLRRLSINWNQSHFLFVNQELHHHIRFVYHDVEMVNAISTLNGEQLRVVDNGGCRTSSYTSTAGADGSIYGIPARARQINH